jgi:glutaredoxin-like protein NrdH
MKTLTIYTKPGCQYCAAAKQYLNEQGITYNEVDITLNEDKADWLRNQGFRSLPVIYAGDEPLINGGWTTLKTMRKHEIMERLAA